MTKLANRPVDAIFFDFDGVILNTVEWKEEVFRQMMLQRAPESIDAIMEYYWSHGGLSRAVKFQWIFANILHRPLSEVELASLADEFSRRVYDGVVHCAFIGGASEFLERYHERWPMYVISGTPQGELSRVIAARNLGRYFRGVHGSPPGKVETGERILSENGYARRRVWFVGDATTERDAARTLGVRFVGLDGPHLTPFLDGDERTIRNLADLTDVLSSEGGTAL